MGSGGYRQCSNSSKVMILGSRGAGPIVTGPQAISGSMPGSRTYRIEIVLRYQHT